MSNYMETHILGKFPEQFEVKDISGKVIKLGDKVKFWSSESLTDPFGFWVYGKVEKEFDILCIREEETEGNDGKWDFRPRKYLEVINE